MSRPEAVPDRVARELAETTFDRNVVVVAGAGTGKTTLLVNRIVHLVVKEPDPVPIVRLVALTFTNKAATEMKVRLRERLAALAGTGPEPRGGGGAVAAKDLAARYRITADTLGARAAAALRDVEKAQIGTLHSFAAHLLRLHPLECGLDPAFREDDGSRFEEHFTAAWDLWIDRELSPRGTHHALWRPLLREVGLQEVRTFARALSSELVDPAVLERQLEQTSSLTSEWLRNLRDSAERLSAAHDQPKQRKIERLLTLCESVLRRLIEEGPSALATLSQEERDQLEKDPGKPVGGWGESEFLEAVRIVKTVQSCLNVDDGFFKNSLKLLLPFVSEIRSSFVRQGWLSFDGLLARARALLRDHPRVRERIKDEYRAILVDEFQDTDPVQYEILLALAEQRGRQAADWKNMELEPGKLFIVGDPKQSIYAFRRADIEAFDRVVEKIETAGGVVQTLTTNFRSASAVLEPVNDVFDRLFERRRHVQPSNVRLAPVPGRRCGALEPGVQLRLVRGEDEEPFDAAGATRAEAELLARWLRDDLLANPAVKPGHVALLFRKLTQAGDYLDALRRHGLNYVIEGEKHFYRQQEVIDLVNILRVLDVPTDEVALVGLLRSPLGGLTDRDVYDLRRAGCCDYRSPGGLHSRTDRWAVRARRLYAALAALRQEIAFLPLADAIQRIFDRLPVLEIAASSSDGAQAVANLLKVKQTAAALADRPHMTLRGFVELMVARLQAQPDEAESPLAEETADAIQILTIHKAKGLEFPVVVLPGLHQGHGTGRDRSMAPVSYDWSSGAYGLALGERRTMGAVLVQEKSKLREEAERRRVLYVGMTRAKELLVLSGGITARSNGDTVLNLLQQAGEGDIGEASTKAVVIGSSAIPHHVSPAPGRAPARRPMKESAAAPGMDAVSLIAAWERRTVLWTDARRTPRHLTPTLLTQELAGPARRAVRANGADAARLTGILAHRILEHWDFAADPDEMLAGVASMVEACLAIDQRALAQSIISSVQEALSRFGRSEWYLRFRRAEILGREIPFLMPWGERQVMEGVIDVLYRLDGGLWIADYKTDSVTSEEAPARAEGYREQGRAYKAAVSHSLGEPVRFHCLFLRCATGVEL